MQLFGIGEDESEISMIGIIWNSPLALARHHLAIGTDGRTSSLDAYH
jgi:hypothetical protein